MIKQEYIKEAHGKTGHIGCLLALADSLMKNNVQITLVSDALWQEWEALKD